MNIITVHKIIPQQSVTRNKGWVCILVILTPPRAYNWGWSFCSICLSLCLSPSVPTFLTLLSYPRLPLSSTQHFIMLMNLVGLSRRGRPPIMQRQMPPVPHQPLLMFKVMRRDRLIKRRLRDALGPSLSHHDGLVASGSRMLQPRDGRRRMEMVPQELPFTYIHTHKPSLPLL